jgi:hypothetical protein
MGGMAGMAGIGYGRANAQNKTSLFAAISSEKEVPSFLPLPQRFA